MPESNSFALQVLKLADPHARYDGLSPQELNEEYRTVVNMWASEWAALQGNKTAALVRADGCGCPTVEAAMRSGVVVMEPQTVEMINSLPKNSQFTLSIIQGALEEGYPGSVDEIINAQWYDDEISGEFKSPLGVYGFKLKGNILGYGWRRDLDEPVFEEDFTTIIPPELSELALKIRDIQETEEAIALFLQSVTGVDDWVQVFEVRFTQTGEISGTFNMGDGMQRFEISDRTLTISSASRTDAADPPPIDDVLVDRSIAAASPHITDWIDQLNEWVQKQDSLEAMKDIASLFEDLSDRPFASTLFKQRIVSHLAGVEAVIEEGKFYG